jgi:hypothetical protein
LEIENGELNPARVHNTPSGGTHLWFLGKDYTNARGSLPPGIDVRSQGGYVVMPGSTLVEGNCKPTDTPGDYTTDKSGPVGPPPDWLSVLIRKKRDKETGLVDLENADLPHNVDRARQWLRDNQHDPKGYGGFGIGAFLKDCGLSIQKATELALEWNKQNTEKWDPDDLAERIEGGWLRGQNEFGSKAVTDLSIFEKVQRHETTETPKKSKFRLIPVSEQDNWPEPSWLVPERIPDRGVFLVYGEAYSGKSFIVLDLALSLATGSDYYGLTQFGRRPVVFGAGEGARGIATDRRRAWERTHGHANVEYPFFIVPAVPTIRDRSDVSDFIDEVIGSDVKPGLVVIDTLSKAMVGLSETDDASLAVEALYHIADSLDCLVVVIHHTAKGGTSPRGSSKWVGDFDAIARVEKDEDNKVYSLTWDKVKDADKPDALYFKGHKVDSSMVLERITEPPKTGAKGRRAFWSDQDVGAALVRLGAYANEGEAGGVSTNVLATDLVVHGGKELEGDEQANVRQCEQNLIRRKDPGSKHDLSAYVVCDQPLRWGLPRDQ